MSVFDGARQFASTKQAQVRDFGFARTVYAVVMRFFERLGFHLFTVQLGDDNPKREMPELPPGYTVEKAMPEDLMNWAEPKYGLSRPFLEESASNGDRCVLNLFHDALVGYGFVATARARATDQLDVVIDNNLVYRYKGWTHPDHRRKHLSLARGSLNKTLFPLGEGRRTVSFVVTHNFKSKLHHRALKPKRIGLCGYLHLFGREYPFTLPGPRRHGFRLARRNS
jgi:hypothetical protein